MDFFTQYEKWLDECKNELLEMKPELVWEFDVEKVDICENGQVYFGNLHITHAGFVTPWFDSEHFIE